MMPLTRTISRTHLPKCAYVSTKEVQFDVVGETHAGLYYHGDNHHQIEDQVGPVHESAQLLINAEKSA